MKKIVIIGANEFQMKLVEKANDLGYETHIFAWEEGAIAKEIADFFYPISIVEKEKILEIVNGIKPDGICSIASDLAMPTVNYIAERLEMTGNGLYCTEVTTNKYSMRTILTKNNLPCPKYQLIQDVKDINFESLNFPIITKPVDRSGSRGIYKVNNKADLTVALTRSKEVSFNDKILIEEYVEGKEYSVEFISQDGNHHFLQLTEKFTTGDPNFIEKGHLAPARISSELKKRIVEVIKKSLDTLKVTNGASHSEIKITPNGDLKIIEIAGRMGGDFIGSDMVYISTGFDFLKNVIKVSVKERIEFLGSINNSFAFVGFIFDKEDLKKFVKVKEMFPEVIKEFNVNKEFQNVHDSASRNGYYILSIDEKEKLNDILKILNMEEPNDIV